MNKKIIDIIKKPSLVFLTLGQRGFLNWIPDEKYLSIAYRIKLGKRLNLTNPETLNEKLQWLKIHDRRPEYTIMVDKYEAKKYISDRIGQEYVVPTLGVWESFNDINFDVLPNQFVLKCTHDSGGLCICLDKSTFNITAARKKIESCLKHNYYWGQREWAYKNVKPRIIAEPYMVDESGVELKDYKVFCFNGKPDYVEVDFNRWIEHKLNPYDFEWNPLNFCDKSKNDYSANIPKPKRIKDMYRLAEKLSEGYPFLRVDFYAIYDRLYVGELTLCPGSGFIQFDPKEIDYKYGKKLKIGT